MMSDNNSLLDQLLKPPLVEKLLTATISRITVIESSTLAIVTRLVSTPKGLCQHPISQESGFKDLFSGPDASDLSETLRIAFAKGDTWHGPIIYRNGSAQVCGFATAVLSGPYWILIQDNANYTRELKGTRDQDTEASIRIAHELNNSLAIIYGFTNLMALMAKNNQITQDRIQQSAMKINRSCDRIAKIVQQLVSQSRGQQPEEPIKLCKLTEIYADLVDIFEENLARKQIKFRYHEPDPELTVLCRNCQVIQILINLINNACDALENLPKDQDRWIELQHAVDAKSVLITVTDSGNGIPLSLRHKIFEPYFTTKTSRTENGLGLGLSCDLARANLGDLWLDATSPHTKFVLKLTRS